MKYTLIFMFFFMGISFFVDRFEFFAGNFKPACDDFFEDYKACVAEHQMTMNNKSKPTTG